MMSEILFLSHRFPFPPDRGDKIRSWHILKALAELAPVHLGTLVDDPRDYAHIEAMGHVCASVHAETRNRSKLTAMALALTSGQPASVAAFGNRKLQAHVAQLLQSRPISTIFAFSSQMAQFVPVERGNRRFVMDFVDVDSEKFQTYADQSSGAAAKANQFEATRLASFERDVAARADLSLFVSEAEASLFRRRVGLGTDRVQPLENGIDLEHFNPAAKFVRQDMGFDPLVVFTGQMDYRPNVEAVKAFVRGAFITIRAHLPRAKFAIVGRAPTEEVKALRAIDGVVVTGEVADTRMWLDAAHVVVAPLLLARGIQNKVLEAMAMAKPVVVSPPAAEGIDASAEHGLFCVLNALNEAEQVISLVNNPDRAAAFGAAARKRMVERYSWDAQLASLRTMVFPEALDKAA
jgi:polysaccharide biosynthesis protein PslH